VYIRSAKKRQRHSVDDNEPKGSIFESASDLTATKNGSIFFCYIGLTPTNKVTIYAANATKSAIFTKFAPKIEQTNV